MKSNHSSKSKKPKQPSPLALLSIALAITVVSGLASYFQLNGFGRQSSNSTAAAKVKTVAYHRDTRHVLSSSTSHNSNPRPSPPPTLSIPPPPAFGHLGIVTTFFWVGERSSGDNGGISNSASTWDGSWKTNFGSEDTPGVRNGYNPVGFTPKENPFYFALPYSDINDNGYRKSTATSCPFYQALKNQPYSWCKNGWIAIRHAGKIVYAQWEDAGPFGENDSAYVFGSSKPANKDGGKAGLDVSPAVRDYLGLQDVDSSDWAFVPADSVPSGPWKQIITSSTGDNSVN